MEKDIESENLKDRMSLTVFQSVVIQSVIIRPLTSVMISPSQLVRYCDINQSSSGYVSDVKDLTSCFLNQGFIFKKVQELLY